MTEEELRLAALQAAALAWSGIGSMSDRKVTDTADKFLEWLKAE